MKKKLFLIMAVTAALFVLISYSRNSPEEIFSRVKAAGLMPGAKRLCYNVYLFGVLPVGSAELTEAGLDKHNEKQLYRLNASARSSVILSKIYPLSASIDSFLEPKTLLPAMYIQNIKTKDKELAKEAIYDQTAHIMQIKGERRSILAETYEPLSALSKLRRLDLEKTNSFDLNINTNQKNYAFTGEIKRGEINANGKRTEIYILKGKIFRRDKNPYHQSKVDFIFLADEDKTPIFIKVFASGGLITARLVRAE